MGSDLDIFLLIWAASGVGFALSDALETRPIPSGKLPSFFENCYLNISMQERC